MPLEQTKVRMADSELNEPVEDVPQAVARPIDLAEEVANNPLGALLEMVAHKKGLRGVASDEWCNAVQKKLRSIGVKTVREFVGSVLSVNRRLYRAHHSQMHKPILTVMLEEACAMMFGVED
jgi:hypothetical protein